VQLPLLRDLEAAAAAVVLQRAGVEEGEEEGELVVGPLREGDGVAGGGLAALVGGQHVAEHLRPGGLRACVCIRSDVRLIISWAGWASFEMHAGNEGPLVRNQYAAHLLTRMALWAGIGGPAPGFTTMSVWTPSFHAIARPCARKAALWWASSSLPLISFTCSHASFIPCIGWFRKRT